MELSGETICFDRYRLHPTQGLLLGKGEIRITPKALGVLHVLAQRPGQIVSKAELFRLVWPRTTVTDATLTSCIKELRKALNDNARAPRFIETVHRRGFRFLPTSAALRHGEELLAPFSKDAGPAEIVGRESELRQLTTSLTRALAGRRQVVFVSGEAGIGKSTLVDFLLRTVVAVHGCATARGECVQHYGGSEAYQPLLEMLTRLARQPIRVELVRALQSCAPLWLAQLPALQTPEDFQSLQRRTAGGTPQRMLRELTDVIEALSIHVPLVLCIEDVHWADPATLDWIGSFARRPEPARVLLLATCRPGQHAEADARSDRLVKELQARDVCELVELSSLDEEAVATYVVRRFPPHAAASGSLLRLARTVHKRTEGNPLFVVSILQELVARGALAKSDAHWHVSREVSSDEAVLPPDLRRMIDQQLTRLSVNERTLLDAACILTLRFSAAAVAAGAGVSVSEAEARLTELARRRTLLRKSGSTEWPDGTLCATFEFVHALYAESLRLQLPPARCTELHRAVGLRLEAAYGRHAPQIAAELAVHFDSGRDWPRAIRFQEHAAHNNLRRSAHATAQQHFTRALQILEHLDHSMSRDEMEINLQIGLGNVLMQTGGWAAGDVQAAYARAAQLCRKRDTNRRFFPALWNLWVFNAARGDLQQAHALCSQLHQLAARSGDPLATIQAHHASWSTLYSLGDLTGCVAHAREGLNLDHCDLGGESDLEYGGHDCRVCARMFSARASALLGHADTALRLAEDGVKLAEQLAHPFTKGFALTHAAAIHLELDQPEKCREQGEAARKLAEEWQFRLLSAWAACYVGAARVQLSDPTGGLALIRKGIEDARVTGSEMFQSHLLGLRAAAELRNGGVDAGLDSVNEALATSARTGEQFYLADLHRIKAELHLARGADVRESRLAKSQLMQARSVATNQGAMSPARRIADSAKRLIAELDVCDSDLRD